MTEVKYHYTSFFPLVTSNQLYFLFTLKDSYKKFLFKRYHCIDNMVNQPESSNVDVLWSLLLNQVVLNVVFNV